MKVVRGETSHPAVSHLLRTHTTFQTLAEELPEEIRSEMPAYVTGAFHLVVEVHEDEARVHHVLSPITGGDSNKLSVAVLHNRVPTLRYSVSRPIGRTARAT